MSKKNEWVTCPNGCGARLYFREVTSHAQTACPERKEPCSTGCGEFVRYKDRHRHKLNSCTFRTVPCEFAPMCRWTGRVVDLAVHLDELLSPSEKLAKVPGDPAIECLYRSYTCWHPPLVAPKEEGSFRIRWPGCGKRVRFGDRDRHDKNECLLRLHECTMCGKTIIGFRVEEHYKGRPPTLCVDTKTWVESGCAERVLDCQFVLSRPKKGKEKKEQKDEPPGTLARSLSRKDSKLAPPLARQPTMQRGSSRSLAGSAASAKLARQGSKAKNVEASSDQTDQQDARPRSPMSEYAPEERKAAEEALARVEVRVEKGCTRQLKAIDMEGHQESGCPERFVRCKHDCDKLIKARDLYAHEDSKHMVQTDLHLAAGDGNIQRVREHVEGLEGARLFDVRVRDEDGNNALHYAIAEPPHAQIVNYLLKHGAEPNTPGSFGRTPLMVASIVGDVGIIEQLVQAKASADLQDALHGWAALHYAAFHKRVMAVTALLRAKADANCQDTRRGDTPLHIAMMAGEEAMVAAMVRGGADVNRRNARKVNVFYHTFHKTTGRPLEVRRGDVPFDLARSHALRELTAPAALSEDLDATSKKDSLDPLFGSTFTTTKDKREPSPEKERALGRSVSPERSRLSREGSRESSPGKLRRSQSPSQTIQEI